MAINDTPWCGTQASKLYLTSGQFTATLKTSEAVGGVDTSPQGISWDGTNTPWSGVQAVKLYLTSGQFTATIKTSENVSGVDVIPSGASWDGTNTPWCGTQASKLYLTSGQFTATLKTSEAVGGVDTSPQGISWDGTNTPWSGVQAVKLYLTSGQFTATIKTSENVSTGPQGMSWDGTNTPWCGVATSKLYLTSGQFSSTLKTSEAVIGIDESPSDIDTNDVDSRLGVVASTGDVAITLPALTVQGGSGSTGELTFPALTVQATSTGATAVLTFPALIVQAIESLRATVALTLPVFNVESASGPGFRGDIAITLPVFTTVAGHLPADIAITLPAITLSVRAYNGSPPECVVMNTKISAVSEYKDYAFNSYALFNGVDLAANQNGIYAQDTTGLDDAVYKIKAHVKTKRVDVYSGSINRLRNSYLMYESDGDVRITSVADKVGTRAYYLALQPAISGIRERRVKFERGIRNRHFDFKIENIDGSSLEVDKFTIHTEPIISKRR